MLDKPRILLVDDDPLWIQLIEYDLLKNDYEVKHSLHAYDGLQLAITFRPHIVVTDLMMPDMDGTAFCQELKGNPDLYPLYIIMASAKNDSYSHSSNLHIGADVYLVKPIKMSELRAHIQVGLRWVESQKKLEKLATIDSLTTLSNRYSLDQVTEQEVAQALTQNTPLSAILLDLDNFKYVNDTYGHAVGDRTLQKLAEIIRDHVPPGGMPARYGGEEFVIILPNVEENQAFALAETLRETIAAKLWPIIAQSYAHTSTKLDSTEQLTASFGVASFQKLLARTSDELFRAVDVAAYRAKREGKNRVILWQAPVQASNSTSQNSPTLNPHWPYPTIEPLNPFISLLDSELPQHLLEILDAQAAGLMRWQKDAAIDLISYTGVRLEVAKHINQALDWKNLPLPTNSLHYPMISVPATTLGLSESETPLLVSVMAIPAVGSSGRRVGGIWVAWNRNISLHQNQTFILLWLARVLGLELEIEKMKAYINQLQKVRQ